MAAAALLTGLDLGRMGARSTDSRSLPLHISWRWSGPCSRVHSRAMTSAELSGLPVELRTPAELRALDATGEGVPIGTIAGGRVAWDRDRHRADEDRRAKAAIARREARELEELFELTIDPSELEELAAA